MAFTVHQEPAAVGSVTNPLVGTADPVFYTVEETTASTLAEPQFSYRLDLYQGATLLFTVLSGVNAQSCGVFQIERLLRDYCSWDEVDASNNAIHQLLVGESNTNALGVLTVKLGWQYQNSSGGFTVSLPSSTLLYFWRGSVVPLGQASSYTDLSDYVAGNNQKLLLSAARTYYIGDGDWGVLTCFTDLTNATTSQIPYFRVRYYDASDTLLSDTYLANAATNPTAFQDKLVYFPCGTTNLKSQTIDPAASPADTANLTFSYYTIDGWFSTTGVTQMTATYTFKRLDCSKYSSYRLAFINHLGGWDYVTFEQKSTKRMTTQKTEYTSYGSNAFNAGSAGQVVYPWDGGVESYAGTSKIELTLNTGFRDDSQNELMKDLLNSPKVYLQEEGWLPVRIVDSDFVYKTSLNDKLVQFTVRIEYGKNNPSLL